MPNKEIPDSDYDVDNKAYGMIWRSTVHFHARLKYLSEHHARSYPKLQMWHVDKALAEINDEISERLKQQKPRFQKSDLILAVGSGLIGVFLTEISTSVTTRFPSWWPFIALVIAILLFAQQDREQK